MHDSTVKFYMSLDLTHILHEVCKLYDKSSKSNVHDIIHQIPSDLLSPKISHPTDILYYHSLTHGAKDYCCSRFGSGTGLFHFANPRCSRLDYRLIECDNETAFCDRSEAWGVRCGIGNSQLPHPHHSYCD